MKKFEIPLIPIAIFGICYLIFTRLLFVGFVPTSSMEPTIPAGSLIVGTRVFRELEVGDVIVFDHDGKRMVKRISAVPGDVVVWDELEYADGVEPPERDSESVVVPEGYYFVLGDNAQDSWDSRYWEEVFTREEEIISCLITPRNVLFSVVGCFFVCLEFGYP